jgi:hypothetical protein
MKQLHELTPPAIAAIRSTSVSQKFQLTTAWMSGSTFFTKRILRQWLMQFW